MPTKYTVTVSTMGTSSVIAIPKPVVDGFELKKGQKLDMIVKDDGIYIPLKDVVNVELEALKEHNEKTERLISKYSGEEKNG